MTTGPEDPELPSSDSNIINLSSRRPAPVRSLIEEALDSTEWTAILSVGFPPHTVRHPRVLDLLQDGLGRACVIDTRGNGVRICFTPEGSSSNETMNDSHTVAVHLLSLLNLPSETPFRLDLLDGNRLAQQLRERVIVPPDFPEATV